MTDRIIQNIANHVISREMTPWGRAEARARHDDLEPRGDTLIEVIDHWFACRVTIFPVGLGQTRWGLTDDDVRCLSEHIEKWMNR